MLAEVEEVDVGVAKLSEVGQASGSIVQSPATSSQQQKRAQPVLGGDAAQVEPPVSA